MDKNILDDIQRRSFNMLDAYRSFTEYMLALKDRDYDEDEEDEPMAAEAESNLYAWDDMPEDDMNVMADDDDYSDEMDYDCEDFPGRETFTLDELGDVDSDQFYRGKSIGIPKAVAVRNRPNQGKLLPISNGLFARGEY